MPVTESQVLTALRSVQDPEVFKDLVTLQQIKSVKICEGLVSVEVSTPSPMKDKLRQDIAAAVGKIPGVEEVFVSFVTPLAAAPQPQKPVHPHATAGGVGGAPTPRGLPA